MSKNLFVFILLLPCFFQDVLAQENALIAHYPMNQSDEDITKKNTYLRLYNVNYSEDGIYCQGAYGDYEKGEGQMISTPQISALDFDKFTISVEFKVKKLQKAPVFSLSRTCRLVSFYLNQDGTLALYGNNGDVRVQSTTKYIENQWYKATITYDKSTGMAVMYLDGQKICDTTLYFRESCYKSYGYKDISTTNFSNGATFDGFWRNMKIYNAIVNPNKNPKEITDTQKPVISWQKPSKSNIVSKSEKFSLEACIISQSTIKRTSLYLNGSIFNSNKERGYEIVPAENCKLTYKENIQLKKGKNEIKLIVENAAGESSSAIVIDYQAVEPIKPNNSPINDKIITTNLQMNSYQHISKSDAYFYSPVMVANKDNGTYLIWRDSQKQNHLTLFDTQNQQTKDIILKDNKIVYAAVENELGGITTLSGLQRERVGEQKNHVDKWIYFVKFNASGAKISEVKLIGDNAYDKEGTRGFSDLSTPRLIFTGNEYAAYFGIYRKWNDGVVHQGDFFVLLDKNGKTIEDRPATVKDSYVNTKGWSWGTSHSFEQRLAYDGSYFYTLAKGDVYPRGIAYNIVLNDMNVSEIINPERNPFKVGQRGDMYQFVPLGLGGIVPVEDFACVTNFSADEGRGSYDIAFATLNKKGAMKTVWLTNTKELDECSPYLAKYGEDFFVAWAAMKNKSTNFKNEKVIYQAAIVNKNGQYVVKPFELNVPFMLKNMLYEDKWSYESPFNNYTSIYNPAQDFIQLLNGDIAWFYIGEQGKSIQVMRLKF